jgi:hypothetical protein
MKKILALVLALTLALGTFSYAAAAPMEDVVGEDCEDAVARLVALGIIAGYPDGTFRPDRPVTRAEFAKIMVSALGIGEAALYAAGPTRFPDVTADHWASGYINVAVDVGIIVGYPDGTFLPENQVTFAEAIKMIVAGLGYTPKAEALGGYPGGYIAVAAEEEITEGVNVVGGLAANRGAIAMMVDNSLEVNLMEQVSYGDRPTWETVDKTLLKNKLGVEEVEGTVTAISKTGKLDENEFELEDENGKRIGTFEMAIDVNTESLFLKDVKILHKDEKVVWVSVETSERDILFDSVVIDGETDDEQVELKVTDKTYSWIDDDIEYATIYVNYEKVNYRTSTHAKQLEGLYGYFIFDGKEIKAANLFDFEDGDRGLVTDVYKDEIEYIDLYQAEEQVLALDDYDEVYVYNKDFTRADIGDIDKETVIFYWENDDDELFVMVVNDVEEGKVTRLRADRVTVAGKNYSITDEASIISVKKGKDFEELNDISKYDIMDERVSLYLDLNGEIAALVTDAKATSDALYGLVTWIYTGRNPSIAVYTTDDKEVEYYFEERSDANIFINDYPNDNETVWAIKYELNSDNEIAEDSIEIIAADEDFKLDFKYHYDGKTVDGTVTNVTKRADRKYVDAGSDTYYIGTDTVIMKALDKDGSATELDPEVIDYETLVDMAISSGQPAIIFGEEGRTAKMIAFLDPDFEGRKDDVYFGVVTDDPVMLSKNDWFAEIDVFGEGKDEYKLKTSTQVKEGELVAFYLDGSDRVNDTVCGIVYQSSSDARIIVGEVYGRDGSYIELGNAGSDSGDYRVASGAVLYQLDGDELNLSKYDLDGTIRLTRIKEGDRIAILYDLKEREVVAAIVAPKK